MNELVPEESQEQTEQGKKFNAAEHIKNRAEGLIQKVTTPSNSEALQVKAEADNRAIDQYRKGIAYVESNSKHIKESMPHTAETAAYIDEQDREYRDHIEKKITALKETKATPDGVADRFAKTRVGFAKNVIRTSSPGFLERIKDFFRR